jgi:hypothetical protein
VAHRTQIILEDEQYRLLKAEAARTGASLGALVRAAVDDRFGRSTGDQREALAALEDSAGAWADLAVDGEAYVDRLRPGRWREVEGAASAGSHP